MTTGGTSASPLLDVRNLAAFYGKKQVLRDVSLHVGPGEVVALIGPNAAGKTTTLRSIIGLKEPRSGTIAFHGVDQAAATIQQRLKSGLVLVPEGRQLFTDFTVRENLCMGAYLRPDRDRLDEDLERIFALFPRLGERQAQRAGSMSGGEQQMVAIGRGLLARPRCLLLDEPTLGLAPIIIDEIEDALRKLAQTGMSILVSEQNAPMALRSSDRAYVLDSGTIMMSGRSDDLAKTDVIRKLYLGE